jgi:hypothetical protein
MMVSTGDSGTASAIGLDMFLTIFQIDKETLMARILSLASVLLLAAATLSAQQALNNETIVRMVKAGLSDDVIVATVNVSAGSYDTTPDWLIGLKKAGVSDKVIALLIQKSQPAAAHTPGPTQSAASTSAAVPSPTPVAQPNPRVYLSAQNSANTSGAALHNQATELSKAFIESCPTAVITDNAQTANYTLSLSRKQLQTADRNGDVIAPPVKNEPIFKGVKRSCDAISSDWTAKYTQLQPPAPLARASN